LLREVIIIQNFFSSNGILSWLWYTHSKKLQAGAGFSNLAAVMYAHSKQKYASNPGSYTQNNFSVSGSLISCLKMIF
jgi:hypothetical protein